MAVDGMSGLWPQGMGHIADPVLSAWRVTNAAEETALSAWRSMNPATAGYLLSAVSAAGMGKGMDARANGGGYSIGFWYLTVSGNSASAEFLASHDSATWRLITATAAGPGTTATGQWSGYYPYIAASAKWVSAGAQTGRVDLHLSLA